MRIKIEHVWEQLDENTFRCKVFKGWMFKVISNKGIALEFCADIDHEWISLPPKAEERKEPYMADLL